MKTYTRLTLPHEEVIVEEDRKAVLELAATAMDPSGGPTQDTQGQMLPRGFFEVTSIDGETIACNGFQVVAIRTLSEDRLQEWLQEQERQRAEHLRSGALTH